MGAVIYTLEESCVPVGLQGGLPFQCTALHTRRPAVTRPKKTSALAVRRQPGLDKIAHILLNVVVEAVTLID